MRNLSNSKTCFTSLTSTDNDEYKLCVMSIIIIIMVCYGVCYGVCLYNCCIVHSFVRFWLRFWCRAIAALASVGKLCQLLEPKRYGSIAQFRKQNDGRPKIRYGTVQMLKPNHSPITVCQFRSAFSVQFNTSIRMYEKSILNVLCILHTPDAKVTLHSETRLGWNRID